MNLMATRTTIPMTFHPRKLLILICITLFIILWAVSVNAQIIRLTMPMDNGGVGIDDVCVYSQRHNDLIFSLYNPSDYLVEITDVSVAMQPANVIGGNNWMENVLILPGTTYEFNYNYFFFPEGNVSDASASLGIHYKVYDGVNPPTNHYEQLNVRAAICERQNPSGQGQRLSNPEENEAISISPNPTTERFAVKYRLGEETPVDISLYNGMGQKLQTLVANEGHQAGDYQTEVSLASELPAGIYYVIARIGDEIITEKLMKL